ncbi:glycine cleavage system protein H [Lactiplantibacillus songbeiensis]|uniref:Glycine cleavage system protein H n=1 Tax=Lactiplantibacillus songbeiensis TaxID=2559920 RepID=A0ABW4BY25_9LACO|nr:glycine cleavage system protein H [Lactiplantibacillus songbeiensis]
MASALKVTWLWWKNYWIERHTPITTTYDGIWLRTKSHDRIILGLTDQAKADIGDITSISYPTKTTELHAGDTLIEITSNETVTTFKVPVGGTVSKFNDELVQYPEKIGQNKLADNWIVELKGD